MQLLNCINLKLSTQVYARFTQVYTGLCNIVSKPKTVYARFMQVYAFYARELTWQLVALVLLFVMMLHLLQSVVKSVIDNCLV
jgi:hypothetical protein